MFDSVGYIAAKSLILPVPAFKRQDNATCTMSTDAEKCQSCFDSAWAKSFQSNQFKIHFKEILNNFVNNRFSKLIVGQPIFNYFRFFCKLDVRETDMPSTTRLILYFLETKPVHFVRRFVLLADLYS